MKIVKLKKQNLHPFLRAVSQEAELWAPVRQANNKHSFQLISDFSSIDLNYTRTILPPRKLLLPPKFNMFQASPRGYIEDYSHVTQKVLFGIHPCDLHGLLIFDQFHRQAFEDPYYWKAKEKTLIFGHSCWPDENCFCKFTHTHLIEEGYDLFFSELDDHYLVWIGSSRGDDCLLLAPELFEESISEDDIKSYILWQEKRNEAFKLQVNFVSMPDLMELRYHHHLWETLGQACLSCGSCSMVCPTCNCYNVNDHPLLSQDASDIRRCWDSCMLENYSAVAGGENFREKRSQRLKLWYTHKLQAYISKYGKPACVGCGRCISTCPVDINIYTVARALEGEEVDAFWNRLAREVNP